MTDKTSPSLKKIKLYVPPKKDYDEVINNLFNKQYCFIKEDNYHLPEPDSMFTSSPWSINELQNLKQDLNNVKSKLNDYGFEIWHQHTSQRNKAGDVQWYVQRNIKPEFLTQAWCKFYENLSSFPVVPVSVKGTQNFTSVHLCEAPGAFITSLNHWLRLNMPSVKWDWVAMTLNPYYEENSSASTINDDRFIIHTLDNWYFGLDDTGNVMNLENVDALTEIIQNKGNTMLVTADGSISCMHNPGEQEVIVSHLHFCEVVTALNILDTGGTLVLKIFTTFEHQTICLVYLLLCMFEEVQANKPATSKEGNSETYLICLGFKGRASISKYMGKLKEHFKAEFNAAMFSLEDLPKSFIEQMIGCSRFFKEHQCTVIMDNINTFKFNRTYSMDSSVKKIRNLVSMKYIEKYNLRKLNFEDEKIVKVIDEGKFKCLNWSSKKYHTESYNEICEKKLLNTRDRLTNLIKVMKSMQIKAKYYTFEFTDDLCELSIKEGKPYRKILNSKFCYPEMLRKLQEFDELIEFENLDFHLPCKSTIELYKEEMDHSKFLSCKFVQFNYRSEQNNLSTLSDIYNAFKEISEGQNLVLFGYCLLSRFNVGLLYILTHTFDSMELRLSEMLGCIITLQGKRIVESVVQKLNQIVNAMELAKSHKLSVLSIIPVSFLCDEHFYPAVVESNAWIIKFCTTCTTVLKATKLYDII